MPFNGRFVYQLIEFASRQGADIKTLVNLATDQGTDYLLAEGTTLGHVPYNQVIEAASALTGDPFFGLHFGESMNMMAAGLVAQITMSSETVEQALQYACDFAQLACSSLPMQLTEQKEAFELTLIPEKVWESHSPLAVRHTIEGTIVFTINEFHELTHKRYFPLRIALPYDNPWDHSEYERLYQCPIQFNAPYAALYFDKQHLQQKVVTSDYHLLRVLVAHAQERLEALNDKKGFYEEVKASVTHLIKPEFPTVEQVARHLHLSVRTLQRRLSQEGHTFKEIIESLRKDFAYAYLKRPELSIGEIAYLLSYTDASAFIRSFKRWEGVTPNDYRRSQLS